MIGEYILMFSIIFVASFYFFGKWNGKKKQIHLYPPSLPSLPLVGSLPFLRNFQNIAEFFMAKSDELGPIFTFTVGGKLVLILNNKEVIEEALVRNSRSFSSRPDIFIQILGNPNSKGIAFMKNSPEFRRIHQSSLSILREFGFGDKNIMEERILKEVADMIEYARKKEGKPFDPKDLAYLMTSNIIMNISFGFRRNYDLGISELIHVSDHYAQCLDMIFDIAPFLKFIPPFKQKIPGMKKYSKAFCDMIDVEIEKSLQRKEICFVSEHVEREGPNFDREQLNFSLRDLISAGTDTTANTFRWAFVALGNNPEIQARLQKDIDSEIPRDKLPSLADKIKLPYLEAVILELYRWRTMVSLAIIHLVEQDSVVKGFFIPAGTLVFPNLYSAHNHPSDWKDPDVFRPERFLDDEGNVIGRDRVIPFSLGRRSCLGEILSRAEIFLFLASLLQRFTVLPPEGQTKISDEPMLPVSIVTVPKAFSVRLLERQ